MPNRVVACHQPNFLPWLGYFAKIARAGVFIFLDDVQFTQGHNRHNWTTRVRIMGTNGPQWLSVPVRRAGEGRQLVSSIRIEPQDQRWLPKLLRTLEGSYRKCPYFSAIYPGLKEKLETHDGSLCELNVRLIAHVCSLLEISTTHVRASEIDAGATGSDRLAKLTRAVGGSCYLAGDGADDYEDVSAYAAQGVRIKRLGFKHPVYAQLRGTDFVPGLSVVDALFNVGAEETKVLVTSGTTAVASSA